MRDRCYGLLFVATAACSLPDVTFTPPGDAAAGGGTGDASQVDAQPGDAAPLCFGSFVRACFSTLPTAAETVPSGGLDIDTDASSLCDPAWHDACVIARKSFSVNGGLRGHGQRALVLISTGNGKLQISASGAIDVSSKRDGKAGAGALTAQDCQAGGPASAAGQYGGFGGTFRTTGGHGGAVGSGEGGTPAPGVKFPDHPRGGCPGGAGGPGANADGGDGGGAAGDGGGAVIIVAASVVIDGQINASGAAGRGGLTAGTGGGGGGGSGGLIVIEAGSLSGNGSLFANGGGGGQGGAVGINGDGDDGRESTGPLDPGTGGQNAGAAKLGGHGGNGSSGSFLGGFKGNAAQNASDGGGGGGGGGAGWIHAPSSTLTLSPPPPG
jgi:hypothetical protein